MLDAGMTTSQLHAIVMTHSHCDHSLNFPTILTGRQRPVKGQEGPLWKTSLFARICLLPIQRLMEGVILRVIMIRVMKIRMSILKSRRNTSKARISSNRS